MRGLADRLEQLARDHGGAFVTHAEAMTVVFGLTSDNGSDPVEVGAARRQLYAALNTLRDGGRIRCKRGAFASPLPIVAAEDLPEDVERPEIPPVTSAVQLRLNRLADVLNAAHEELAELRHDLRVAERFEGSRPSFPMRCAEPWEHEP
jgi:hypothetical protein